MTNNTRQTVWKSSDGKSLLQRRDGLALLGALPDASVDCVWTDPPYFLSNNGTTCVAGKRVSVNKGEWDRSDDLSAVCEFNRVWLAECYRILKPAGTIWVSGTYHVYLIVGVAMMERGFRILNDIIWEKANPPPNLGRRCFAHATETILWATKAPTGSQQQHTFRYQDIAPAPGEPPMTNVWRFPAAGRREKKFGRHPTQKPAALIDRCLRVSTSPGDLVLDPFAARPPPAARRLPWAAGSSAANSTGSTRKSEPYGSTKR